MWYHPPSAAAGKSAGLDHLVWGSTEGSKHGLRITYPDILYLCFSVINRPSFEAIPQVCFALVFLIIEQYYKENFQRFKDYKWILVGTQTELRDWLTDKTDNKSSQKLTQSKPSSVATTTATGIAYFDSVPDGKCYLLNLT